MTAKLLDLDAWESRVKFVFDSARTDCMSWPDVKRLCDVHIYPELGRRKSERRYYGQYVVGVVAGMIRAYQNIFYDSYVEFCYKVDGVLYTINRKDSQRPHIDLIIEMGRAAELQKAASGFYWKTADKIYFASSDPEKKNEVPT
jgi:hypothetical protein